MKIIKGKYNSAKVFALKIDDETNKQVKELLDQEFTKDSRIAIMPDCHAGAGCVIGTTMTIKDKIVPFLVGVDVGCGMLVAKFAKDNLSLKDLDDFIHENIPAGMNVNDEAYEFKTRLEDLKCWNKLKNHSYLKKSMCSLGGGNHFIELDIDEKGYYYLVVHTGSRNLGTQIAEFYQKRAISYHKHQHDLLLKQKIEEMRKKDPSKIQQLVSGFKGYKFNENLCYLEGEDYISYLHDMNIAQNFASENRRFIMKKILKFLGLYITKLDVFESVHNYINMKDKILRKGSIAAYRGQKLIIPINMRDGCIIGVGKGNKEYNYSAPHGAGRILSRKKAKETISLEDYKKSMKGIYSTCINMNTIDESCFAYKPIESIIPCIKDSVDIINIIKPIYNFKCDNDYKFVRKK